MTQALVPTAKKAITVARPQNTLSPIVAASGESAARRFLEYFTVTIRNRNTRRAYWRACNAFLDYAESKGIVDLRHVEPMLVAAYIEKRTEHEGNKPPSPKQDLAAIRGLFDYLVTGGIIPFNPAAAVKGPAYVVRRGKTPILNKADAKKLLEGIPTTYKVKRADGREEEHPDLLGLRDRALIGLMIFTFARVGAATKMQVGDYYQNGKRWFVRLHEKGGKEHELPVHHKAEEYLDAYLKAAGIEGQKKTPLFRSAPRRSRTLSERSLTPETALEMVKRRATQAGITAPVRNHTFRGTGITAYLESGGTIENAQAIANHADTRTTKLYDRRGDRITLDEIEKIQL